MDFLPPQPPLLHPLLLPEEVLGSSPDLAEQLLGFPLPLISPAFQLLEQPELLEPPPPELQSLTLEEWQALSLLLALLQLERQTSPVN